MEQATSIEDKRPGLDISAFDYDLDLRLDSVDFVYKGYGQEIDVPVEGYTDSELSFESSEDHEARDKLEGDTPTAFQKQQVRLASKLVFHLWQTI